MRLFGDFVAFSPWRLNISALPNKNWVLTFWERTEKERDV